VEGIVILTPVDIDTTQIDYTFVIGGLLGMFAILLKGRLLLEELS
jgi:hypothetical protein